MTTPGGKFGLVSCVWHRQRKPINRGPDPHGSLGPANGERRSFLLGRAAGKDEGSKRYKLKLSKGMKRQYQKEIEAVFISIIHDGNDKKTTLDKI